MPFRICYIKMRIQLQQLLSADVEFEAILQNI